MSQCARIALARGGPIGSAAVPPAAAARMAGWGVGYHDCHTLERSTSGGATWLQVDAAADSRPTATEPAGPLRGYRADDVNLALGNLVHELRRAAATYTAQGGHRG